ncbi:MAG TPA: helix-turn-helix domain-containing protein [Patescibacteria group bacterium]|nr:helix-turn-helix domain-containing protein [Patescibacteria group bacterium]
MPSRIYTIGEAAQILKVHRTYVASLIADKKLAALKIGRFYRIRQNALEKLIGGKLDGAIFTIEDIAELLQVHRSYVAKLISDKRIKAVKIGKFYRVREKDFEDFLRKSEV